MNDDDVKREAEELMRRAITEPLPPVSAREIRWSPDKYLEDWKEGAIRRGAEWLQALCSRVDTEARQAQREAGARKCDAVASRLRAAAERLSDNDLHEQANGAEACADAIRSNGEQQ